MYLKINNNVNTVIYYKTCKKWSDNMKKKILLSICVLSLILISIGCSKEENKDVSLEIWHYYNGAQKIAFDELVEDFNETLGLEENIIVEAFGQSDISQLEGKVIEAVDEKVGGREVPNMVTTYPEIAYALDQREIVCDLEGYITKEEMDEYLDSYIEEGRLGKDNKFKIFPTAKATEVMMVNKTDWDKFAQATGAKTKDLESWEGVRKTAESYYNWTDSLTDEKNDGKSFFGRDALANYMLVGSKQLGKEIVQINGDKTLVNLDHYTMRRLWDNYYLPYVSGYYTSYGRFSTDDAKTGEIIALVGSTTGATYFPSDVTIGDEESYEIELMVLPLPNFENEGLNAVQQGAGIAVLKSDKAHEKASVEFLKWFTEDSRNLKFATETGYLPVKKQAYDMKEIKKYIEENKKEFPEQLQITIPLAMEQVKSYDLNINKAFEKGGAVRKIIDSSLEDRSKADREKFIELIDQGMAHEDAVGKFNTDENFENWLLEFEESLIGALEDEK